MEARPAGQRKPSDPRAGLCPRCRWVKTVTNERGSRFLRCRRARDDPRFPKYPPQPVLACIGFEE